MKELEAEAPQNPAAYSKAIAYLVVIALGFLTTALADDVLTVVEAINLAILLAGGVGVYLIPNLPQNWFTQRLKTFVAAVAVALTALVSFLADNVVTTSEWLQIGVAFLGALGVYIIPNDPHAVVEAVEYVPPTP